MADALRIGWRQYRLERRMFWRNPSAAFFNFLLPLLFLALFGGLYAGDQENLDILVPGIAGMSIVSTTFVALTHNFVALREQGMLKRLRGTPMPTASYLGALAGHAVTNAVVQLTIVIVAGDVIFSTGWPQDWGALAVFAGLGVACFALLGVALAHAVPSSEAAPAYVNAVFLPLIAISGVFYDGDDSPAFLRDFAEALPLTHLIDGLNGAMITGNVSWSDLTIIALWTLAGAFLAVRGFSWEAKRS
ncbi:MAG TPA: ABC transporter permease [Solirubrobacteraceae bacterium]|nr:ABC transporter permease [Solirubrobacteraceae bacterium]